MTSEPGKGLRLACFGASSTCILYLELTAPSDAGGIQALSQAEMMESLMNRIRKKLYPNNPEKVVLPCEMFDMMGGSDTGG